MSLPRAARQHVPKPRGIPWTKREASSSTSARARAETPAGGERQMGTACPRLITPPSGAQSQHARPPGCPPAARPALAPPCPGADRRGQGADGCGPALPAEQLAHRAAARVSAASRAVRGRQARAPRSAHPPGRGRRPRSVQVGGPRARRRHQARPARSCSASPGRRRRNSSTVPSASGWSAGVDKGCRSAVRRGAEHGHITACFRNCRPQSRWQRSSPPGSDLQGASGRSCPASSSSVLASRSAVGGRAPVSSAGGACPWRRDQRVWKPAVAISAASEARTRAGTAVPCSTRYATASVASDILDSPHPALKELVVLRDHERLA